MSKHTKYSSFSSVVNDSADINKDTNMSNENSLESPIVDTVAPVTEPAVVTPTVIPTSSYTSSASSSSTSVNKVPDDADILLYKSFESNFLSLNHEEPRVQKERERVTVSLYNLVKFVLSKDKRNIYDLFYRFVKDHKYTHLNPHTVFAGGDNKLKRSDIGVLTMTIAAFNRVQDNLGVNFKELEKALPGHPILITYLSEKSSRKQNI
jgi:hypothetical protein